MLIFYYFYHKKTQNHDLFREKPNVNGNICSSVMASKATSGTSVEVVMDDDWTRIVMNAPKMIAITALRSSARWIHPEVWFLSDIDIILATPYKDRHISTKAIKIAIIQEAASLRALPVFF